MSTLSREEPAVRHRSSRAVFPETMNDAEAESLYPHMERNETGSIQGLHHEYQPQLPPPPVLSKLVKGMPAESVLLLNVVAVIWGSQHPIIKMVVDDCDPSVFSFVRFAFAALIASVFSWNTTLEKEDVHQTWRWGAEMGLWMFLGYAFQAVGLEVR
jgi:EamA-like transporter family